MRQDEIDDMVEDGVLVKRNRDAARARTLLESSDEVSRVMLKIVLDEHSANPIFRELYECIRQLGEAKLWLSGLETKTHEPCMRALMDEDVKDRLKLKQLDRFRQIRNSSHYRGIRVSVATANEIIYFWQTCGVEILERLKKRAAV
jgi:hypothetical protein